MMTKLSSENNVGLTKNEKCESVLMYNFKYILRKQSAHKNAQLNAALSLLVAARSLQ